MMTNSSVTVFEDLSHDFSMLVAFGDRQFYATTADAIFSETVQTYWTNFAKTG